MRCYACYKPEVLLWYIPIHIYDNEKILICIGGLRSRHVIFSFCAIAIYGWVRYANFRLIKSLFNFVLLFKAAFISLANLLDRKNLLDFYLLQKPAIRYARIFIILFLLTSLLLGTTVLASIIFLKKAYHCCINTFGSKGMTILFVCVLEITILYSKHFIWDVFNGLAFDNIF